MTRFTVGTDWTATSPGAAEETPVRTLAGVLSFGLLVHGWDYAVATGGPVDVTDALADYVLELAEKIITPERRANGEFARPG